MSRIVVMTTTFPQWEGDPRGAFIRRHWELSCERGDDVTVLAPHTRWCSGELSSPLGVKRIRYAPGSLSSLTGNFGILENIRHRPWRAVLVPFLWRALRRALVAELESHRVDLVVGHMLLPAGWIVAAECSRREVPFELYGHGTDVDLAMRLPAGLQHRFAARMSNARTIYFPSAEKRERFRRALAPTGETAPLQVERMLHAIAQPPPGLASTRKREILFLGRLIRQKGVDALFRAAALMTPTPLVHVAGDGPERRRLERLAAQLGIRARFHGYVSGETKDALLRSAGVLCVPSRELPSGLSEGAPLVIVEAMAYGLPVVATRVGGIPELRRSGYGIRLVAPDTSKTLAAALADVLDGSNQAKDVERVRERRTASLC